MLNVWGDHVWAYDADAGCHAPAAPDKQEWAEAFDKEYRGFKGRNGLEPVDSFAGP